MLPLLLSPGAGAVSQPAPSAHTSATLSSCEWPLSPSLWGGHVDACSHPSFFPPVSTKYCSATWTSGTAYFTWHSVSLCPGFLPLEAHVHVLTPYIYAVRVHASALSHPETLRPGLWESLIPAGVFPSGHLLHSPQGCAAFCSHSPCTGTVPSSPRPCCVIPGCFQQEPPQGCVVMSSYHCGVREGAMLMAVCII